MKMKINSKDFRVPAGKKVDLKKWPTCVKPVYLRAVLAASHVKRHE